MFLLRNNKILFEFDFHEKKKTPNTFQSFSGKNGQHLSEKKPRELYESFVKNISSWTFNKMKYESFFHECFNNFFCFY
jgi:hypothetical protein